MALLGGRPNWAARIGLEADVALAGQARRDELDVGIGQEDLLGLLGALEHLLGAGAARRRDRDLDDLLRAGVDERGRQQRNEAQSTATNSTPAASDRPDLRPAAPEDPADRRVVEPDPERVLRLAGLVDVVAAVVDEEVGEDRHDRQRHDERGEQRERDGQRERQEELADEPTGEAERQEHRDRRQGARGDRAGDLAWARP